MISHLTYQSNQAHLEHLRSIRASQAGVPGERKLSIRARLAAFTSQRRRRPAEPALPATVAEPRLQA